MKTAIGSIVLFTFFVIGQCNCFRFGVIDCSFSSLLIECFLFQYKEDLSSDEEIFAEKSKEIESLKGHVRELEEERATLNNQLQETLTRLKKHEDQLFRQQLQLNQLLLNQGGSQGACWRNSCVLANIGVLYCRMLEKWWPNG